MTARCLAAALCAAALGCTNAQLRHNTVSQARTLTELQHQQVLNNLAAFACNPHAIPFHVNLHDGTSQITDNGAITTQVLSAATLSLGAQRTAVDQWSMTPVTDDTTIRLLRVAYRRVLYPPVDLYSDDPDLANDLAHELKKQTVAVDDLRTTDQSAESVRGIAPLEILVQNNWFGANARVSAATLFEGLSAAKKLNSDQLQAMRDEAKKRLDQGLSFDVDELFMGTAKFGVSAEILQAAREEVRQLIGHARSRAGVKGEPDRNGYSRRDILKYRVAFNSIVSANGQYIVFPWETLGGDAMHPAASASAGERPASPRNLSYLRLPDFAQVKLTLKDAKKARDDLEAAALSEEDQIRSLTGRPRTPSEASAPPILPSIVQFEASDALSGARRVIELPIDAKMEADDRPDDAAAAKFRKSLEGVFGQDYVSLAGGPLREGVPVTINLLGQVAYTPAQAPKFQLLKGEVWLNIEDEPRYLKVTPIAVELRRQIMDTQKNLLDIGAGWLGVGCSKQDVPGDACYVAHWKDCGVERYVWVCPGSRKEFEEFTIKILNFSGLVKNVQVSGTSGVKYSPGTSGGFFAR